MRGGYKLIDCNGENINALDGVIIAGIFLAIKAHNGKNIKLTHFRIGTEMCNDACVNCEQVNATKYRIRELYGIDFYITSDDKIKRSNSELVTHSELETYVDTTIENLEVPVSKIVSGSETAGKALLSDGDGYSIWGTLPSYTKLYLHRISFIKAGTGGLSLSIVSNQSTPCTDFNSSSFTLLFQAAISIYKDRVNGVYCGFRCSYQGTKNVVYVCECNVTDPLSPVLNITTYDTSEQDSCTDTVTEL